MRKPTQIVLVLIVVLFHTVTAFLLFFLTSFNFGDIRPVNEEWLKGIPMFEFSCFCALCLDSLVFFLISFALARKSAIFNPILFNVFGVIWLLDIPVWKIIFFGKNPFNTAALFSVVMFAVFRALNIVFGFLIRKTVKNGKGPVSCDCKKGNIAI